MSKVFFEETQYFRENRWIVWLVTIFSFCATLPFLYGLYWQLVQHEPWGDKPMTDNELIVTSLLVFLSMLLVMWIILSVKLEVKIDEQGVQYRFFPNRIRWKLIPKESIASYEIKTTRSIFASGGLGYQHNYFKKLKSMTIQGGAHLLLHLNNGQHILIGTQQHHELERTMKKLTEASEND
ncbi:MAG: hypothetical protein JNM57_04620 [Cyclobacteriaceae bacterium]|nr:hypothetical protein [Cyclobacteriaceae bacterium]